jgi:hypothetical protein
MPAVFKVRVRVSVKVRDRVRVAVLAGACLQCLNESYSANR